MHHRGEDHHNWRGDEVRLTTLHQWLNANYLKTGVCAECGNAAQTAFALIHGRAYSRNREDYRELCVGCHNAYDGESHRGEHNGAHKLNEDIVRVARCRKALGETLTAMAREYGVSRAALGYAVRGDTWGWVV